jgi:ribonuclease P protein component
MLSKINRLRKQKDIDSVFSKSRTAKDGDLTMKVALNSLNTIRFCFIVSRRVSKDAVGRNKIKRRLREIARSSLSGLARGYDLLVIASPGAAKLSFPETKSSLRRLFERLGLLVKKAVD